jgi:urea transport system ATP-binding protein
VLEARGVNQFYGGSHILWNVDLRVDQGACTCLMGRNGVGKTTLLKAMMGLVPIERGEIRFKGESLGRRAPERRARLGIGYVPQGREIFAQLTVEENLRTGLAAAREESEIPPMIFELFPVLAEMLDRLGGDLSGGQQQQLAIGRALVSRPDVLILDEPTEGIQPNVVHQIGDVITRLNRETGLTVLLVEQKLPFARRVADNFAIMEKGRIVAGGGIGELSDRLVGAHLSV